MGTPKLVVAVLVAELVIGSNDPTSGQSADVAFSFTRSGEATRLRATGAAGVVFEKQLAPNRMRFDVLVSSDTIGIEAVADGTMTISRGERAIVVRADRMLVDHAAQVTQLTEGSAAADGLERMVLALAQIDRPEALSVRASLALLRSLQGDRTANLVLAQHLDQRLGLRVQRIADRALNRGPIKRCWRQYEERTARRFDQYSRCLRQYWWAQPVLYACGLEWAIAAELALFELMSCWPLP